MMADRIIINDVGPRDGLQNQPRILRPAQRLRLISALIDAGLPAIEVGSFVSPRAVPAMASTEQVVAGLFAGVSADAARFSAFVP
ncbi:MAG TPA: hydroxymethylglutaryl-CoA lyase, partial [Spongiibacteraceae bacterium]|nr:hydroxymethylglutaryl-CoA lyase [Spongiibacteraceae bacterium]